METILSRYTDESIKELFGKYHKGFKITVQGDATAGINLDDSSDESISQCIARFKGLGFDVVHDKYLTERQKKSFSFHIFFTNMKRLTLATIELAEEQLLEHFTEASVKPNGSVMVSYKTGDYVTSYVETNKLEEILKRYCTATRLAKRTTEETKLIGMWASR